MVEVRMEIDPLVENEIAIHDWGRQMEADGPADRIPDALRELLNASCPDDTVKAYWRLENHVVVQGALFEAAVSTVSVISSALARPQWPTWVMIQLLELLFQIVSGESHVDEVARGVGNLGEQCRGEARKALWLLYAILASGKQQRAISEILERIEESPRRLAKFNSERD